MEEDALLFEDFVENYAVGVNIRRRSPTSLEYRPVERNGLIGVSQIPNVALIVMPEILFTDTLILGTLSLSEFSVSIGIR